MAAGSHPLNTSTITTINAGFHPRTLKTLVPPALPLPCSLISIFLAIRPIIILVGVEPVR